MSEASTTSSDTKSSDTAKDGAKAKKSDDAAPKASTETSAEKSPAASTETSAGKSPAASNGKSDVYYGKFSNVKNPAYRGGWDDIWGNGEIRETAPTRKNRARKKSGPMVLDLDIADMPKSLRAGLAKYAGAELKRRKSRLSYDKRDAAGGVDWRITCRIER